MVRFGPKIIGVRVGSRGTRITGRIGPFGYGTSGTNRHRSSSTDRHRSSSTRSSTTTTPRVTKAELHEQAIQKTVWLLRNAPEQLDLDPSEVPASEAELEAAAEYALRQRIRREGTTKAVLEAYVGECDGLIYAAESAEHERQEKVQAALKAKHEAEEAERRDHAEAKKVARRDHAEAERAARRAKREAEKAERRDHAEAEKVAHREEAKAKAARSQAEKAAAAAAKADKKQRSRAKEPAPGWASDPSARFTYRWWDGSRWTDQVWADGGPCTDRGQPQPPPPPTPSPALPPPPYAPHAASKWEAF